MGGYDETTSDGLREFAGESCKDKRILPDLPVDLKRQIEIHVIPRFTIEDHSAYIKKIKPDAVLVLAKGVGEVVTFNPVQTQPKSFNKGKFEKTVKK